MTVVTRAGRAVLRAVARRKRRFDVRLARRVAAVGAVRSPARGWRWTGRLIAGGAVTLGAAGLFATWRAPDVAPTAEWTVDRGDLVVDLVEPGTLRAARSTVHRSPANGRELEVVHLASEGAHVAAGDLVARLETRDLEVDLQRAVDGVQEAEFARQVAELELLEATAALDAAVDGEGSLTIEESRSALALAERRVARLRRAVAGLEPLLEQGFITGDGLERSRMELETAEADLALARRRARVLVEQTHPVARRRAELQLAQKRAQWEGVERRVAAARRQVAAVADLIERCTIRADGPGLVVYEEFRASSPRRKVRLGDRVTPSQGIVRVVEVDRMLVETSVAERSVHRVRPGQPVAVRLEAFPDLLLSGRVMVIGALARTTREQFVERKRFDVTVALDPTDAALRPEMTARVDIRVGERADVLRLPVSAVFERDGRPVVRVPRAGRVEDRPVALGEQNARFVEVLTGVTAGERVLLLGDPAVDAAPSGAPVPQALPTGTVAAAAAP